MILTLFAIGCALAIAFSIRDARARRRRLSRWSQHLHHVGEKRA
jgi:hypothetical protein